LIYYARSSWFIKTTAFKDEMIKANEQISWFPEEVGSRRFGEWLENNIDWALSRERYWGTPLPVWICANCKKQHCIGSIEELRKMATDFPKELDLHRPYVDRIGLKCPGCGETMNRTPEIIDAWFDSGSMPYGQVHYPFEHETDFEDRYFPAEFIAEGLDQTRGWFYSMLAISVFISGRSSYKRCVVNNLILDNEGRKMSKRLGNVVEPKHLLNEYGADAVRWYLMSSSQIWLPKKFDKEALVDVIRRFLSTLHNSFSFFSLYANIDDFIAGEDAPELKNRPLIDRWIISRMNGLIDETNRTYDQNDITQSTRAIAGFVVDDLSNWYVRRSRRRFWGSQDNTDKKAAYQTLFECLLTVCKLAAPVAPFMAEDLYRRMTENLEGFPESVHLTDFPTSEKSHRDSLIEEEMAIARRTVELGRSARKESKTRIRQPLSRLVVLGLSEKERKMLRNLEGIVLEEINIKKLEFDKDETAYLKYRGEPDFKKIGPKFEDRSRTVAQQIKSLSSEQICELVARGSFKIGEGTGEVTIESDDLKVKMVPSDGYAVSADGYLKVALDLTIDDDLLAEGNARELVNKIQNLRKSAGLVVTDRITLSISSNSESQRALQKFTDYIKDETLTTQFTDIDDLEHSREFDLNGVKTIVALKKIS
jgi:isoleucyl-tRNA synthetase